MATLTDVTFRALTKSAELQIDVYDAANVLSGALQGWTASAGDMTNIGNAVSTEITRRKNLDNNISGVVPGTAAKHVGEVVFRAAVKQVGQFPDIYDAASVAHTALVNWVAAASDQANITSAFTTEKARRLALDNNVVGVDSPTAAKHGGR